MSPSCGALGEADDAVTLEPGLVVELAGVSRRRGQAKLRGAFDDGSVGEVAARRVEKGVAGDSLGPVACLDGLEAEAVAAVAGGAVLAVERAVEEDAAKPEQRRALAEARRTTRRNRVGGRDEARAAAYAPRAATDARSAAMESAGFQPAARTRPAARETRARQPRPAGRAATAAPPLCRRPAPPRDRANPACTSVTRHWTETSDHEAIPVSTSRTSTVHVPAGELSGSASWPRYAPPSAVTVRSNCGTRAPDGS